MVSKFLVVLLLFIGLGALCAGQAAAQSDQPAATLPDTLSTDDIDGVLSRLTDAQLRAVLRDELVRRAEQADATDETGPGALDALRMRIAEMSDEIGERLPRWAREIASLDSRLPVVRQRLARGAHGVGGMVLAALALCVGGLGAALLAGRGVGRARDALCGGSHPIRYWERLFRSLLLTAIDLIPVVVFVVITRTLAPFLAEALGPLNGMVWIYHAGVSAGWAFLVIARRLFAPDVPRLRIAPLDDGEAVALLALLRRVTVIGVAGWLIAGHFPNLGFGFPPALVTVALAGTAVALVLGVALWRSRAEIVARVSVLLGPSALVSLAARTVPPLAALYLAVAWLYWLAHWLERGQHRLEGPLGSLLVLLMLPVFDRMGREAIASVLRAPSEAADRFRRVLGGASRILIGVVAFYSIVRLWGLDLLAVAKGPGAPVWASTTFDIGVTLVLGYLAWRLIRAALHTEEAIGDGGEDGDPLAPRASRLDTLTPLFRTMLLVFLAVIVVMIVLSSLGVDIGPLLASAGIFGIAIGFGAQTLVRDIFSGVFFLIDDAFRTGEYIELEDNLRGTVEGISIRSLQLRHHRGAVITIPFGELKQVTNHTRDWVIYKMAFRLEPETDPQQVKKVVKRVGAEFLEHPEHGPKFLEPLKSQGVYAIDDDSALIIRVKFKCVPKAQFILRREIYHRLRAAFAENDIRFARRKVEVVGGSEGAAAAVAEDVAQPKASPADSQ